MKSIFKIFLILSLVIQNNFAQQKLGQTGFKFLNYGMDARATSMGQAFTALEANSQSIFYNSSSMARQKEFLNISIGSTKWIADITDNYLSASINPYDGEFGVFGLYFQSVDYGLIEGTIFANNEVGYLDEKDMPGLNIKPTALSMGVGYAKALSDKFSVGGNLKYVAQDLGESVVDKSSDGVYTKKSERLNLFAFDFGLLYKTGYKSLNFGMTIRNFAQEVKFEKERFQLPLIFKIGASVNAIDFFDEIDKSQHSLLVSVDATHPRDYPEQLNLGMEYQFMEFFALRSGYMFNNDVYGFTSGVGVRQSLAGTNFGIDYAFTPFDVFDSVHRFSLQFSF